MLDGSAIRDYLLAKNGAEETYPFGEDVRVFKVMSKVFALMPVNHVSVSLKCDPVRAQLLRDTYPAIKPGYHLNKRHWNTIEIDGSVPDDELKELIDHSYQLVVTGLKSADRQKLLSK